MVSIGAGVVIDEFAGQHAVDQQSEFTGGGSDGFGFSDAHRQAAVKRSEGGGSFAGALAQRRRMAATRLAEGGVRELSRRPPEILLLGVSEVQEAKWYSLGQRRMSVPISAMMCSAACGPMESIWLKSAPPVSRCRGAADIELGLMFANLPTARRGQRC